MEAAGVAGEGAGLQGRQLQHIRRDVRLLPMPFRLSLILSYGEVGCSLKAATLVVNVCAYFAYCAYFAIQVIFAQHVIQIFGHLGNTRAAAHLSLSEMNSNLSLDFYQNYQLAGGK